MKKDIKLSLYAVCPPGLEEILTSELGDLGIRNSPNHSSMDKNVIPFDVGSGGIEYSGTLEDVYRTNLLLRSATRIILRFANFHASKFAELVRKVSNLEWEKYIQKDLPISLRVTSHRSKLYHTGAIAERIIQGISERLGFQPKVEKSHEDGNTAQLIIIRFVDNECAVSLDSSGLPLHYRGYRQALAKAPLRETLAAGILIASGWDQQSPLLDPFCGSGVIPTEAALMAAKIPPGRSRRFAFMDWPSFKPSVWNQIVKTANQSQRIIEAIIMGSDRDAGAIKMAVENAERAGVADQILFSRCAVSAIQPPAGPGWIVTNPPYGVRISRNQDLRNLYAQFGNVLRTKCPGWQTAFLCDDDRLATRTGVEFIKGLSLVNGGIPVKLNRGFVLE